MCALREPDAPPSVNGVRPEVSSKGMRSRLASISMLMEFAVPTLVCSITACGLPVTMVYPCAIDSAAFSCGTTMGCGTFRLVRAARANASTIGAKSVPGLQNK